jgi:sec-independent protein translocase protein TatB
MFDFGMGEIVVLAVLALLVLGPEQIPTCARQLGRTVRQIRQVWARLSEEFDQALGTDESSIKELSRNIQDLHPEREPGPTSSHPPER